MRTRDQDLRISVLSLAVRGALAAMFALPLAAQAADPALEEEVATIRKPTNFVEAGVEGVSRDSAKFGEYNGLNEKGAVFIGNIGVRGGDAYQGGDGTVRWGINGSDLGTTSRELGATVENQGRWNLKFGYEELRHHITDSYQTPQQGSMGGNTFTLPADFGVFNAAAAPSARILTATQLNAFHTEEVSSTRKNTSLAAGLHLTQQLSLKFDFNNLVQDGAKLIGAGALGGVTVPTTATTWRAEAVAILMNPTDYETNTFNLGLNWIGDRGHLSGSYHASIFKDTYDSLSYQNPMMSAAAAPPAGTYQTNTLSTAPDNQLHQLNLTGGYAFSPETQLAGGISYGRNTQNNGFLTGMPEIVLTPQSSLDGKVITTHADLKLTNRSIRNLSLSAGFKYNERDNRSQSNVYQYYALNNRTTVDYAANAPYSNKKSELELAGDYRFNRQQSLRLAYNHDEIDRWCNSYALVANCLVPTSNTEDTVGARYRLKASDGLSLSLGYSLGKRKGTYDHNAVTPLAGLDSANPDDVNSQNYPGYFAMPYAKRDRDLLKAGINWQASDRVDLGIEGRYAKDKYDATLGVQNGESTGVNMDATFTISEDASVSAYLSWSHGKKDMRIGASGAGAVNAAPSYDLLVAPTNIWTNQLIEEGQAIGVNGRLALLGGRLELKGDLSYSKDTSTYSTQVPYLATCSAVGTLSCGTLPDIRSEVATLRLSGTYALDKASKLALGYIHQRLRSDDYFYNWYQYGYTGLRGMPTNQVAPNYEVHLLAASYIYSFK
ncbi:MAG: MtrB/PioB family decaheme-associated outer membrane protein [Rhodocyclales bacterium]|nr:MtrB/PioB family decaheme-associated outer membrane protein [Rhodocyclales bacterium]